MSLHITVRRRGLRGGGAFTLLHTTVFTAVAHHAPRRRGDVFLFLMSSAVQTILRARGRVALIKITKPPVNSLGFAVRKGIADGLDAAEKDGASAVVFAGDGATFPAGADITEFAAGGGFKEPTLTDIIERVSALKLHTVAAIHGTALGGGLELALGCHWRLADAKAKCGLPEVHLGILPGAGGTQRLPRIVGCEEAIKLMTRKNRSISKLNQAVMFSLGNSVKSKLMN